MVLLNLFLTFCITLTIALVGSWLLPLKKPWLYWALMVAGHFLCVSVDTAPILVQVTCYFISFCVIPFVMWDAPRAHRLLCALSLVLMEVLIEVVGLVLLSLMGFSVSDSTNTNLEFHAAGRVIGICCYLLFGLGLSKLVHHLTHTEENSATTRAGLYAPFLILQTFATVCVLALASQYNFTVEMPVAVGTGIAALGSMMAVILSMVLLHRQSVIEQKQRSAERTQMLLHECLKESQERLDSLQIAARFRHDQRNHLQVVAGLASRKEYLQAADYVSHLREGLEQHDRSGEAQ